MKKIYLFITIFLAGIALNAQTNGSLTFSVTTTSTGNYSPKHVVAIWIEKNDGTFVKTKLRWVLKIRFFDLFQTQIRTLLNLF